MRRVLKTMFSNATWVVKKVSCDKCKKNVSAWY